MTGRVDVVLVHPDHRIAFEIEMAGRSPHPRVRVVMLATESLSVGPDSVILSTCAHHGAELVDPAHAAAAALTGMHADPAETRAPGRPISL